MAIRPIPFSDPMIAALREGRKTRHRVALKLPTKTESGGAIYEHPKMGGWEPTTLGGGGCFEYLKGVKVPVLETVGIWHKTCGTALDAPYQVGDHLYVQEAIQCDWMINVLTGEHNINAAVAYYTSDDSECLTPEGFNLSWLWKVGRRQARFMPRAFSRMTLIVTDVRVQRLHEISSDDAIAEGVVTEGWEQWREDASSIGLPEGAHIENERDLYEKLWDTLNGPGAWEANPWVVAISFTVHHCNIDALTLSPKE